MRLAALGVLFGACGDGHLDLFQVPPELPPEAVPTASSMDSGAPPLTEPPPASEVEVDVDVLVPSGTDPAASSGTGPPVDSECQLPNLVGIVRDFRAADEAGGHPDFQAFEGTTPSTGIVEVMLGPDRKPVYAHEGAVFDLENGRQTTSRERFDQWYRNTEGVNASVEIELELVRGDNGISTFQSNAFFPIDGRAFGNYQPERNGIHNYHFTFELHTELQYRGGEVFQFSGDDDLWVFINDRLAIDLGGLHIYQSQSVSLDDIAAAHGLEAGNTYPLDLFHAERKTLESNFRIDTSLEFTNCQPIIIL